MVFVQVDVKSIEDAGPVRQCLGCGASVVFGMDEDDDGRSLRMVGCSRKRFSTSETSGLDHPISEVRVGYCIYQRLKIIVAGVHIEPVISLDSWKMRGKSLK